MNAKLKYKFPLNESLDVICCFLVLSPSVYYLHGLMYVIVLTLNRYLPRFQTLDVPVKLSEHESIWEKWKSLSEMKYLETFAFTQLN